MSKEQRTDLVGINHVALEVGDIEEALQFYARLFRFKLRGRSEKMAFIDMGDQFLALAAVDKLSCDEHRHFGLVVADRSALRAQLLAAGIALIPGKGLNFRDPWGNFVQVVDYAEIQFSKTAAVLNEMGLTLEKSHAARDELAHKGML